MTLYDAVRWTLIVSLSIATLNVVVRGYRAKYLHEYEFWRHVSMPRSTAWWIVLFVFVLSPPLEELLLSYVVRPELGVLTTAITFGLLHGIGKTTGPRQLIAILVGTMSAFAGYAWAAVYQPADVTTHAVAFYNALGVHYLWNLIVTVLPEVGLRAVTKIRGLPEDDSGGFNTVIARIETISPNLENLLIAPLEPNDLTESSDTEDNNQSTD